MLCSCCGLRQLFGLKLFLACGSVVFSVDVSLESRFFCFGAVLVVVMFIHFSFTTTCQVSIYGPMCQ